MKNQNIQIIRLGPMRVASLGSYGIFPDKDAWKILCNQEDTKDLIKNANEHPVFGFNNNRPSQTNPEFGYEIWIKVSPGFEPQTTIQIIDFSGGLYAVARRMIDTIDYQKRYKEWENLRYWCKNNNIKPGYHQALEKFIRFDDKSIECILDLYYPIIY